MSRPADAPLEPDPVIEAYKKDVDRTLLRENLKLTPWERLKKLEDRLQGLPIAVEYAPFMTTGFKVEVEREDDGRWLAEVMDLPGVLAYGATRDDALKNVEALALRVLADRVEHGDRIPEVARLFVAT